MIGQVFDGRGICSFKCPHCNDTFHANLKKSAFVSDHYIITCATCYGLTLVILGKNDNEGNRKVIDQYPTSRLKLPNDIPTEIRNDFEESIKCLNAGVYKASVGMCRRALQQSAQKEGANKNEKLHKQIESLHNQGKIPKGINDWATEIRYFGNYGAHPQDDDLENITYEDAKDMINFMSEYCKYVYIMPAEVKRKKAERTKRKGKT